MVVVLLPSLLATEAGGQKRFELEAATLRGCPATHPFLAGAASRVITPVVEGGVPPPRIAGQPRPPPSRPPWSSAGWS